MRYCKKVKRINKRVPNRRYEIYRLKKALVGIGIKNPKLQ